MARPSHSAGSSPLPSHATARANNSRAKRKPRPCSCAKDSTAAFLCTSFRISSSFCPPARSVHASRSAAAAPRSAVRTHLSAALQQLCAAVPHPDVGGRSCAASDGIDHAGRVAEVAPHVLRLGHLQDQLERVSGANQGAVRGSARTRRARKSTALNGGGSMWGALSSTWANVLNKSCRITSLGQHAVSACSSRHWGGTMAGGQRGLTCDVRACRRRD